MTLVNNVNFDIYIYILQYTILIIMIYNKLAVRKSKHCLNRSFKNEDLLVTRFLAGLYLKTDKRAGQPEPICPPRRWSHRV